MQMFERPSLNSVREKAKGMIKDTSTGKNFFLKYWAGQTSEEENRPFTTRLLDKRKRKEGTLAFRFFLLLPWWPAEPSTSFIFNPEISRGQAMPTSETKSLPTAGPLSEVLQRILRTKRLSVNQDRQPSLYPAE